MFRLWCNDIVDLFGWEARLFAMQSIFSNSYHGLLVRNLLFYQNGYHPIQNTLAANLIPNMDCTNHSIRYCNFIWSTFIAIC